MKRDKLKTPLKRKQSLLELRTNLGAWLLLIPAVFVMYIFIWRPTVMGFVWSLFKMRGYTPVKFIGFRNYVEVITDTQFLPTLFNTVKYVLWSLIVGFVPPLVLALLVSEMVYFKKGLLTILYLPAIIPGIAAMLMWAQLYNPANTGFLNTILIKLGAEPYGWLSDGRFTILWIIVTMTWQGLPGAMLLYYSAIQGTPQELYEAALIDGAGIFKRIWNVTRPQIMGIVILNFVSQIISVFQVMEQPLAMTGGGPNGASISLGYQLYRYGFVTGRAGHAMALGTIIFVILIFATIFYFRLNKKVEENY